MGQLLDLSSLLSFALILVVAAASPGPTVAALVARVVGRGHAGIAWFCAGLILGDVIWMACAAFGLAAIASAYQPVFVVIKYLGAAYLLWLTYKMRTAPVSEPTDATPVGGDEQRALGGGLALALGDPKTMLFYVALLPHVVPLDRLWRRASANWSASRR